ncbi:hypothetical protein NMG60_11023292 [Bertholletia excelsa]
MNNEHKNATPPIFPSIQTTTNTRTHWSPASIPTPQMDVVNYRRKVGLLPLMLLALCVMISPARPDDAKDREECAEQLASLATCLPYVQGNAKAPTPDCCNGLKQVLKTNKKCLCVVIKDRNDPNLGLSINVTLALGLPSVCNAPANVSQCPALLHLPPNSPDAQVFYQFGHASNSSANSPAGSPVSGPTTSPSPSVESANANSGGTSQKSSGGACRGKRWVGMEVIAGGLLLACMVADDLRCLLPLIQF